MTDFNAARKNMVECQLETNGIIMPDLLDAFAATPREIFAGQRLQNIAYVDDHLTIDDDRTMLSPMVLARMIQALEPSAGDIALDIGGATGYSAAILSRLVTTVIAIEQKQSHIETASEIWEKIDACNIAPIKTTMTKGSLKNAPYDVILINGALYDVPTPILEQMAPEGRLAAIVKKPGEPVGQAVLFKKVSENNISSYALFETICPYLTGFEPREAFVF